MEKDKEKDKLNSNTGYINGLGFPQQLLIKCSCPLMIVIKSHFPNKVRLPRKVLLRNLCRQVLNHETFKAFCFPLL